MLTLVPTVGDTGTGHAFFSRADCLGAAFTRAPRQHSHGADGAADPADTGAGPFGVPVEGANGRLRVKVVPTRAWSLLAGSLFGSRVEGRHPACPAIPSVMRSWN